MTHVAVIDHGDTVETVGEGGVEAGVYNRYALTVELYTTPELPPVVVNVADYKVTIKQGNIIQGVYHDRDTAKIH